MQQKNMKPCDSTLAAVSVSCSRALELDLAETFLAQISNCDRAYPFNAFLEACDALVSVAHTATIAINQMWSCYCKIYPGK